MSAPLPPNESRGPKLIAEEWTTMSIAALLVFLRIYTRAFLRKTAGWDDWTIVIALAFAVGQHILVILQVDNGFGRHIEYLQPDQISKCLLLTAILTMLHTVGTFLVRISVCLFVLRLVPPTHRELYRYTYLLIAFFTVITTATFLLFLLACIPIQGAWDMEVKARCIARSDLSIIAKTQGGFSALMDFLCVCLPIFILRNLQAKLGRKICLFVLLGLGLFTGACAILRTCTISLADKDFTWHSAPVAFWSSLEQNVGIIVASIPALHQLYTTVLQKFSSESGDSYPHLRPMKFLSSPGDKNASNGSQNEKLWLSSRGSRSMRMTSKADGEGTILPGPPSPTKKEPRMDYDSPTLDISPKLEQAATGNEEFTYVGLR